MEAWFDMRQRGLIQISKALRSIDNYNLSHEDSKVLDYDRFIFEIMQEFKITSDRAKEWLDTCMEMNRYRQKAMETKEHYLRSRDLPLNEDVLYEFILKGNNEVQTVDAKTEMEKVVESQRYLEQHRANLLEEARIIGERIEKRKRGEKIEE